jgi:hypothetical protein
MNQEPTNAAFVIGFLSLICGSIALAIATKNALAGIACWFLGMAAFNLADFLSVRR